MDRIQRKKILIIDDEKKYGEVLKLCLEKFDFYRVDVCTNGLDGLEKLGRGKYDLVILDILMPKMEGHEVLEQIKVLCDTPVIILSAFLPPLMEKEVIRRGAFACLRKPVEIEQIILVIHRAFSIEHEASRKTFPLTPPS